MHPSNTTRTRNVRELRSERMRPISSTQNSVLQSALSLLGTDGARTENRGHQLIEAVFTSPTSQTHPPRVQEPTWAQSGSWCAQPEMTSPPRKGLRNSSPFNLLFINAAHEHAKRPKDAKNDRGGANARTSSKDPLRT